MEDQESIYVKYLDRLKMKLIATYDELGLRASGKYEEELEGVVEHHKMIMLGAAHSPFMERGRSAGGFPPRSSIEEWIDTKQGLPAIFRERKSQFAFLIARKIAEQGIKVPNQFNRGEVISSVVDDFLANDIDDMLRELGVIFLSRIESDVLQIFAEVA